MDCNLNFEEIKPSLADELYQVPITKYLIVTHGWLRHQSIIFQDSKYQFQILASYWQTSKGRHICRFASQIHFQQDNYIEYKGLYKETNAKVILKACDLLAIQPFNHMFNNCRDSLRNLVGQLNNNNLNSFYEECKLPVYGPQIIITETQQNFEDELITYCIRFHDESILVFCGKQMNLLVNFKNNYIKQCKDLILPTMWYTIGQVSNPIKVSEIKKDSVMLFNANKQNHKSSYWGLISLLNIYEIS